MSKQEGTILHVDDNEANRYVVARILRNAGFEVEEAVTGAAGLLLATQQPDLIILDVQLPDLDGFEVCRRLKANPATSSIPVLHLSASFVKSEDKAHGLEGGADGYLTQPVEPIELLATVRALLRIRQAEESALTLAREWQTTFDAISDGICLLDREGRILRCNNAMTNLLRKPFSEIKGQLHEELMQTVLGSTQVTPFATVQKLQLRESMEIQVVDQCFSVTTDPVFNERGAFTGAVYIVANITDRKQAESALQRANDELKHSTVELAQANQKLRSEITERQRIEEALRERETRYRLVARATNDAIRDWNLATNEVEWNEGVQTLFGYSATYLTQISWWYEHIHPQDKERVIFGIHEAINSGRENWLDEYRYLRADNSYALVIDRGFITHDEQGNPVRIICSMMDITQRKQAEESIKMSLQEKEVLLKEIHHRVKNNMQVICSLLNLQAGVIEDSRTLEVLQEGQNRIYSMALVHEQLYQSKDLMRIDSAEYIRNLADNLFVSYDISSEAIALKIDIDNVVLDVDAAIPCGLIINELVSNSLKYAFLASKSGEICIALHADNKNNFTLTVSDNGVGFPQNLDFENTESLGLQLVTALTKQLSGTIKLNRNTGTEFKITF